MHEQPDVRLAYAYTSLCIVYFYAHVIQPNSTTHPTQEQTELKYRMYCKDTEHSSACSYTAVQAHKPFRGTNKFAHLCGEGHILERFVLTPGAEHVGHRWEGVLVG